MVSLVIQRYFTITAKRSALWQPQLIAFALVVLASIHFTTQAKSLAPTHNLSPSAEPQTLRIAVAANFHPVLAKIAQRYTAEHGTQLELISGASGTLFQQIYHGAPFDIFLSADSVRPAKLAQLDLIVANSRTTYATGKLALWSSAKTIKDITDISTVLNEGGRLAIANPKIAPYGKAAFEALSHFKLWQQAQGKLITGINIGQTFAQTRSQAAQIGIVAQSQLVLNGLSGYPLPQESYQPIAQQLVIVKRSVKLASAQHFVSFLLSDDIQQFITSYGYQSTIDNNLSAMHNVNPSQINAVLGNQPWIINNG